MSGDSPIAPTFLGRAREIITDSLGYWEPRRLLYNLTLAAVILIYFGAAWPASKSTADRRSSTAKKASAESSSCRTSADATSAAL